MGKKSVKENKNIYFLSREDAGFTRAEASEHMPGYSENRIEKLENERTSINPEDVLAMAKAYKKPELCNYYCANECPIGQNTIPEIKAENFQAIVIGLLSTLNSFESKKNKLIDIASDGKINDYEIEDYVNIQNDLDKMSISIEALKIWVKQQIANECIDAEKLEKIRNKSL